MYFELLVDGHQNIKLSSAFHFHYYFSTLDTYVLQLLKTSASKVESQNGKINPHRKDARNGK